MSTPTKSAAPLPPRFQVAAASVTGRDHQRVGRNNQDAWAVHCGSRALIAVVADGCGSAPHSEAGARLGARLLLAALARRLEPDRAGATCGTAGSEGEAAGSAPPANPAAGGADRVEALLEETRREVLAQLRAVAVGLCPAHAPDPRQLLAQVRDHLLFTLVGAIVGAEETVAFALGDGLLEVDGRALTLGPFPGNEPPYLGYALLPEALHGVPEAALRLQILARLPTAGLRTLALGTDGACDLAAAGAPAAALLDEGLVFRNPDALRRRLFLLARETPGGSRPPPLHDDTTLVLIRRNPAAAA